MENRENARLESQLRMEREKHRKRRYRVILFRRTAAAVILIGIIVAVVLLFRGLSESTPTAVSRDGTADNSVVDATSIHREVLHDTPETDGLKAPFNQMSMDWSGADLNGWWRYTIPDEYSRTGGYLPDLVQVFTFCLCKGNNIRYSLVLALIEAESGYHYDAVSAANDIGYMQVNYKWHMDKMEGGRSASTEVTANISGMMRCEEGIEYRLGDVRKINFKQPVVLNSDEVCPKFREDMEKTAPDSKLKVKLAMDRVSKHISIVLSGFISGERIQTTHICKASVVFDEKVYNDLINHRGMTPSLIKGIKELIIQLLASLEKYGIIQLSGDDYTIEEIYRKIVEKAKRMNGFNGVKVDKYVHIPTMEQLEDMLKPLYGETYSKRRKVLDELKEQGVLVTNNGRSYQCENSASGTEYRIKIEQDIIDGAEFGREGDDND